MSSAGERVHAPHVLDEARGLICARTPTVRTLCDPLGVDLWRVGPITAGDIHAALNAAPAAAASPPEACPDHAALPREYDPLSRAACRRCELDRIVFFARSYTVRSYTDQHDATVAAAHADACDPHPITLDVGYGLFVPNWLVVDGNHRLAAAIATRTPWLAVAVVGDWDRALALLVDEHPGDAAFG